MKQSWDDIVEEEHRIYPRRIYPSIHEEDRRNKGHMEHKEGKKGNKE